MTFLAILGAYEEVVMNVLVGVWAMWIGRGGRLANRRTIMSDNCRYLSHCKVPYCRSSSQSLVNLIVH